VRLTGFGSSWIEVCYHSLALRLLGFYGLGRGAKFMLKGFVFLWTQRCRWFYGFH
jgi:hypothetical protein